MDTISNQAESTSAWKNYQAQYDQIDWNDRHRAIDQALDRAVAEYGSVLKRLASE